MITKPMRVIESPGSPSENDLWLNGTTLRKYHNGEWVKISGGGKDDEAGSLPVASASTLGAVKVGTGLNVTGDGVLSVEQSGVVSPLVVQGTIAYDDTLTWPLYSFTPDSGELSFSEVETAYLSGREIRLSFNNSGINTIVSVIGYYDDGNSDYFECVSGSSFVCWYR